MVLGRILRNRYVIGAFSIALAVILARVIIPRQYVQDAEMISVMRLREDAALYTRIDESMLAYEQIPRMYAPAGVLTNNDAAAVVGKYAALDLYKSDNLIMAKFTDSIKNDPFLYENGDLLAISVTVKSLAAGLSGKLAGGDAVSVYAYISGYNNTGNELLVYPELECVRLVSVVNSSGIEISGIDPSSRENRTPAAATLLVNKRQAERLAEIENGANVHLAFIARGVAADAKLAEFGGRIDAIVQEASRAMDAVDDAINVDDEYTADGMANTDGMVTEDSFTEANGIVVLDGMALMDGTTLIDDMALMDSLATADGITEANDVDVLDGMAIDDGQWLLPDGGAW